VAKVKPFRALRYGPQAGPLDRLVAPPYDVIGPEEREHYLSRSPYNIVHLTLPDSDAQAAEDLAEWRERGHPSNPLTALSAAPPKLRVNGCRGAFY